MSRTNADLVRLRLASQHLAASSLGSPAEVVAWFGAVQAQDTRRPDGRWGCAPED